MQNRLGSFAIAVIAGCSSSSALSVEMDHHHHDGKAMNMLSRHAPIEISINPEARVSVVLAAPVPASNACRRPIIVPVKILNDGFVTAHLEAHLVGNVPSGVTMDFRPKPLSGKPEDWRQLAVTLMEPGTKDLTISFKAHNDIPDLGGRDRIHFLISCRPY